jgi:hypothetical protein
LFLCSVAVVSFVDVEAVVLLCFLLIVPFFATTSDERMARSATHHLRSLYVGCSKNDAPLVGRQQYTPPSPPPLVSSSSSSCYRCYFFAFFKYFFFAHSFHRFFRRRCCSYGRYKLRLIKICQRHYTTTIKRPQYFPPSRKNNVAWNATVVIHNNSSPPRHKLLWISFFIAVFAIHVVISTCCCHKVNQNLFQRFLCDFFPSSIRIDVFVPTYQPYQLYRTNVDEI